MSFLDALGDLFSGSYNKLGGLTEDITDKSRVDQIFSGINYLQALSNFDRKSLRTHLNSGEFQYFPNNDPLKQSNSLGNKSLQSSSTDSIFNKFSIFAYQNFASGGSYKPEYHFIGAYNLDTKLKADTSDTISSKVNLIAAAREIMAIRDKNKTYGDTKAYKARTNQSAAIRRTATTLINPNVKNIIEWANQTSAVSVTGFQPYAMTDFMFCRNYGKIPNNRLVTLRRYPFPIDDQIKMLQNGVYKSPIPIAQAVTWFGGDTGNVLSSIGVQNWGMGYKELITTAQDITGNEVTVESLQKLVEGLGGGKVAEGVVKGLKNILVGFGESDAQLQQLSGMEAKFQEYAKNLYSDKGPYWNRIFGPVNVVDRTMRRERGMQVATYSALFTLNFHYQFRSFNGLSPKIVALDLISSFLNLTYNDAQFLGQLARYFPAVGLKFNPTITEQIGKLIQTAGLSFNADVAGQLLALIKSAGQSMAAASSLSRSKDLVSRLKSGLENTVQATVVSALKPAMPEILSVKSALSDRPVGEWHLVIGNPMNPIMVMGDLLCSNCKMVFDTEIGPEDFPTGITFTVTLQQGKPRDKVAIERMFNLGESQLMRNKLKEPASAADTFGEENTKRFEDLKSGIDKKDIAKTVENKSFQQYQNRVRKSYGYKAGGDSSGKINQSNGDVNDSLLYMYFDKGLNSN